MEVNRGSRIGRKRSRRRANRSSSSSSTSEANEVEQNPFLSVLATIKGIQSDMSSFKTESHQQMQCMSREIRAEIKSLDDKILSTLSQDKHVHKLQTKNSILFQKIQDLQGEIERLKEKLMLGCEDGSICHRCKCQGLNDHANVKRFRHFRLLEKVTHSGPDPNPDKIATADVAEANSLFSSAFHSVLREEINSNSISNLIFSPFSVSVALAMAKIGARGVTGDEIKEGLHFPIDDEILLQGYSEALESLRQASTAEGGVILSTANGLYVQQGCLLHYYFRDIVVHSFGANVKQLDFGTGTAAAEQEINEWAQQITNNKIKKLIPQGALSTDTKVVIVNALYFKGFWKHPFDPPNFTRKAPFYVDGNEKVIVQADMMCKSEKFPYFDMKELETQVVGLPYKEERVCILIYLPRSRTGLSKLVEGLKTVSVTKVLEEMNGNRHQNNQNQNERVEVHLPRFRVESAFTLIEPLQKLGLKSMFSPGAADFSEMSPAKLHVYNIFHKAVIEVTEEGTEAAAATAILQQDVCLKEYRVPPVIFKVEHPFAFQIVDRSTKFVLFAGSCSNPTLK